jgi:hypothetical protein
MKKSPKDIKTRARYSTSSTATFYHLHHNRENECKNTTDLFSNHQHEQLDVENIAFCCRNNLLQVRMVWTLAIFYPLIKRYSL